MSTRACLRVWFGLWVLSVTSAVGTALVPALRDGVQSWLALRLEPHAADGGYLVGIVVHNLRAAGWPLLVAARAARWPSRGRFIAATLVTTAATVNVVPVGAALGAYGAAVIPYLTHLPLEWAALSIPLGACLAARHQQPSVRQLALAAGAFCVLVLTAGLAETYLTPHT